MYPLTRSTSRSRFFGLPFSPASLFAAGEQGFWYDPSDYSTLFQDSAGTTPVTAVEQAVGLMLDKSKGLVLGSELVTNGDFSGGTTTGWTPQSATLSVNAGRLEVVTSTTFGYAYQSFATVAGQLYRITFSYDQGTATIPRYFVGTSVGDGSIIGLTTLSGTGTITRYFFATTATTFIHFGSQNSSGQSVFFDNISTRVLPGNHAFQTTSAKRPVLRARYNLLTYSEQFDNAAWTKGNLTVSANAAVAPDGTVTADLLTESTAASANFFFNQTAVLSASTAYTYSIYCKPNGRSRLYLAGSSTAWGAGFITYNLNTGVVSPSSGSGWTGTIENLPDGWYRITATRTTNAGISGGYVLSLFFLDNAGNVTYTGDGVSGMYFWGADLRPTSQATGLIGPTYQRVAAATDYDTTGFLPYLQFDGVDDAMTTNSIDFTATDKMTVFAGVRKLSGSSGVIAELSTNVQSDNGSFVLAGAFVSATTYDVQVRGTDRNARSYSTYTAPVTNVLQTSITTAAADSSSAMQTRVDGAVNAGNSFLSVVSTGNFGNYPLFIGARNQTSLYFNGQIYSLIGRGAATSAGQISATETWVAGKTGVQI